MYLILRTHSRNSTLKKILTGNFRLQTALAAVELEIFYKSTTTPLGTTRELTLTLYE